MARRKVVSMRTNNISKQIPKVKQTLICPVCKKEFEVSDDTKYIVKGGYVCDWKCFKQRMKDTKEERQLKMSSKSK